MSTVNPVFTKVYRDKILGIVGNDTNLGDGAGEVNQGTDCVAIGKDAGHEDQGNQAIAIGKSSGYTNQGADAIAIGYESGKLAQGVHAIAVGWGAGLSSQSSGAVAIGSTAGTTSQATNAVAIGIAAGAENQEGGCVAIGSSAGNENQGTLSVAIGEAAGYSNQGTGAVAIGNNAGQISQGQNSIAIGKSAGTTLQEANTIILNATGSAVETLGSSRTLIAPIRNVSSTGSFYPMNYNPSTKELAYSGTGSPIASSLVTFSAASAYDVDNIPSWVNHIQVVINNAAVANTTTTPIRILVGPIGTHWTSGYNGIIIAYDTGSPGSGLFNIGTSNVGASTFIPLLPSGLSAQTGYNAILDLKKLDIVSTVQKWTWVLQGTTNNNGTKALINGAGSISGTANQVIESVRIEANVNITNGYMKVFMY